MNGNLVVSAVVKSEEWKTSLFDIVVKWKSDCLLAVDSATDGSWKAIFNACKPWEFAHMANITLCTHRLHYGAIKWHKLATIFTSLIEIVTDAFKPQIGHHLMPKRSGMNTILG
jgi:hypothetical protein